MESFLNQYYEIATDIPKEILVPHKIEHQSQLQKLLKENSKKAVKIIIPKKGTKIKLLEMSLKNARIHADRNRAKWQEQSELTEKAAKDLQKVLKLKKELKRIECYDISHLSGTDTVGSMVVFEKGAPNPKMYRKFKMRTVVGKPDDYKSMEEVLRRRFGKLSRDIKLDKYKFKKALKKYDEEIQKQCKKEGLNIVKDSYKLFHILEKEEKGKKSLAAFGKIKQMSDKVSGIHALCVMPKERGKRLGYKLKVSFQNQKPEEVTLSVNKN